MTRGPGGRFAWGTLAMLVALLALAYLCGGSGFLGQLLGWLFG